MNREAYISNLLATGCGEGGTKINDLGITSGVLADQVRIVGDDETIRVLVGALWLGLKVL